MSNPSDSDDAVPQSKNYIITGGHKDQRVIKAKKVYAPKTKGAGYSQNPKTLEAFLLKHNIINRDTGHAFPMTTDMMLRYLDIKRQTVLPSNVSWYRDAAVWAQKQLGYDASLVEKAGKHPDVNELLRECNALAKIQQTKQIDGSRRVLEQSQQSQRKELDFVSSTKQEQEEERERIPTVLIVTNLPVGITTERVKGLFSSLAIRNIAVVDRKDKSSAGAKVTFSSLNDADAAIARWNNKSYNGRLVKCKLLENKS